MLRTIRNLNVTIGLMVCVIGLSISSGCAKPPTKEMADAEAAVSAAKMAEADVYVPQEYKSAEDMLNQAKGDMQKKEYKTAKDSAIKTIELAGNAKEHAVSAREKAKNEAAGILTDLKSAIDEADKAGAKRLYPKDFQQLDNTLGELRTAFQVGKYLEVISKGKEAISRARDLAERSKRAAEEETRRKSEEEARRRAEEEARRKAEENARLRAEEEARHKAEEEAHRTAEKEEQRQAGVKPETHKVVKGECLWIISGKEKIYHNPFMWPLIYKENRSQIHDPDLIFPKQDLKIPRDYTQDQADKAVYLAKHRGPWSLHDGK